MINMIKQKFLDYHRSHGFKIYDSFPLVIDDPTVLFTNATITPFKSMFTGEVKMENYALSQKCLRLGGTAGNLETSRSDINYTSLFDMLGSGFFNVSMNEAVHYFVELLSEIGFSQDRLIFSTLSGVGFDEALKCAGVASHQIFLFDPSDKTFLHEWSFGEGDLHGHGIVVRVIPEEEVTLSKDNIVDKFSEYIQIGRIVHINGISHENKTVEEFPYMAFDVGLGLSRVECALLGNSESSMRPWREISYNLQGVIPGLSKGDAHYIANLYYVAKSLISEKLVPGKKKHSYVLRKIIRLFIEELWVKSKKLVDIVELISQPQRLSDNELFFEIISQEEKALRKILSKALKKRQEYSTMSPEELWSTFGIKGNLLNLLKQD